MQENGGKFTIKSLKDLSYLDRCIKESLRLYPSAPFITRLIEEDVTLRMHLINLSLLYMLFKYIRNILLNIKTKFIQNTFFYFKKLKNINILDNVYR